MDLDERILQLKRELDRVRPSHPARLPSWVAAAAVAAGLTISGGACSRESHTDNPADNPAAMGSDLEPGPAVALYAGPPPESDAPPPLETVMTPPAESVRTPPPPIPPYGVAMPPPPVADPMDVHGEPSMREDVAPPVPAYGVAPVPPMVPVMKSEETLPAPMTTPMLRPSEPVTDYGGPFL